MRWLAASAFTILLGILALEAWMIRMLAAGLILLALFACG